MLSYKQFNIYTQNVEVELLKPGDVLANDILFRNGTVLVKADTELNDQIINKLMHLKSKVVTLDITKVYLNGISATQTLFKDASDGKSIQQENVKHIIEPIMNEFARTRNVVSLLLKLRSDDEYTFQHTLNIGIISSIIARWLGYDKDEQLKVAMAGTLHDIGKSRIPLTILNKPAPLTSDEFEIMKTHSELSYEILSQGSEYDEEIKLGVLQHHERQNGKGYPHGLSGDEISQSAKIVSVADIYHAMTSKRVYQDKVNPLYVLDEIRKAIDTLDPTVVLTFIKHMAQAICGCNVSLSDGRTGVIITVDEQNLRYPVIKLDNLPCVLDLNNNRDILITDIYEA